MTTTFFLVRHAAHDNVGGFLAGRSEGIRLGRDGRAQAERLAERMRRECFAAIVASPRERTVETAMAISLVSEVGPVEICRDLDEVDFGPWSGKTFDELNRDPDWRRWNDRRNEAVTPAGESMADVGRRVHACLERVGSRYSGDSVVLVSHADVIKAAVCKVLGVPVDACFRFEIDPASITTIVAGSWGAKLLRLNEPVPEEITACA